MTSRLPWSCVWVFLAAFNFETSRARAKVIEEHNWLLTIFNATINRVFPLDLGTPRHPAPPSSLCSLTPSDSRPNFFLPWTEHPSRFGQLAFASLEALLFHHPFANVVLLTIGSAIPDAPSVLDAYVREGYCVVSSTIDTVVVDELLSAATGDKDVVGLGRELFGLGSPEVLGYVMNLVTLALQVLYGGVSFTLEALLLNPVDLLLPKQLRLMSTVLFHERMLPLDGPPSASALEGEDFDRAWLPRAYSDRADAYSILRLDLACPRAFPASNSVGVILLQAMLQKAVEALLSSQLTSFSSIDDVSEIATTLYRLYVRERPKVVPMTVEGYNYTHEMVVLPYWVTMDAHFSDGWKSYGGQEDLNSVHSQLYTPRSQRGATDWLLVSGSKMWLPLGYGPQSARNILPRSVVDLALRYFTLGIMPQAYRTKSFGKGARRSGRERRLRSPRDAIEEFGSELSFTDAKYEAALPGDVGGFRTFRQIRLVGMDHPASTVGEATGAVRAPQEWKLVVRSRQVVSPSSTQLLQSLRCRQEARPINAVGLGSVQMLPDSAAYRLCSDGLRRGPRASEGMVLFESCGYPAELNAAVSLLSYDPTSRASLGSSAYAPASVDNDGLDFRLDVTTLGLHFSDFQIIAHPGCSSIIGGGVDAQVGSLSITLSAFLDDVEDYITVVAHCAERCYLLDRLALSFREVYNRLPIVATCECSDEETCLEAVVKSHETIPNMTVISVPYDFGLSRGKALLAREAQTEFVLVLDDDFVFSFHSCLECMLWRMRSRYHSQWRPFDILGFPILEDERLFGAFRGKLRVTSHQLFLEPFVEQTTPDGCLRVDICPMVFLARTQRFRLFKFQEELQVGEHEQFFYSNAHFGAQVAVCFDSSFPHFRVNTMSPGYVKRRERMPDLMLSAFSKLGFQRAMYLFRKYAIDNMTDYDSLLEKNTPPWYISDDTCGPRASPPVQFTQVFVVVLSTGDSIGAQYRQILRRGGPEVWFQQVAAFGRSNFRCVFAIVVDDDAIGQAQEEQEIYRDVLLLPSGPRNFPVAAPDEGMTEDMLRLLALIKDFQFRWLLVVRQDVFVSFPRLVDSIQKHDTPIGKVLGSWTAAGSAGGLILNPMLFAISRDVFGLLSDSRLSTRLAHSGVDIELGDMSRLTGGLNVWLRAFALDRVALPGLYFDSSAAGPSAAVAAVAASGAGECPPDTLALGPLRPERLRELSEDPLACGGAARR